MRWDLSGEGCDVRKGMRPTRFTVGSLAIGLALALGACRARGIDHSADVAELVTAPTPPDDNPSGFEPVAAKERTGLPTDPPSPYLIGVGDVLKVRVLGTSGEAMLDAPLDLPVRADGAVAVPILGKLQAKDKPVEEVEEAVRVALQGNATLKKNLEASVEVAEFRARRCRIVGDGVDKEQYLTVNGRLTLLEALIEAGATRNKLADRDEAYLIRAGKVHPFSIAAMVGQGDASGDFVLAEGDHVVVPSLRERQDYVYVLGQVREPGRFEMQHTGQPGRRGRMSLMGAVAMAGGFIEGTVDCDQVCIFRGGYQNLRVFHVGVNDIYRDGDAIALLPGDRVYVSPNGAAKFNQALSQFLPALSGAGTAISLGLSSAALYETAK